ncbi:endolytic transglycosylase MltG [Virgibacillus salarius]|uniref:endolytic transglycosylase MltG n=1 Tax=Virgibacillus salarius TaxID=447199 RepID=UPI00041BC5C0|nr:MULTISPECIES: endolytic transglycosylase MltG [Bacillaceae]WBX79129.1 endolytic transglycosylase MltG [Virgibacillus salarius]
MKQPVRVFAIGLLTAGIIMLATYLLFKGDTKTVEGISEKELISLVKDKGYHVLSNSEYVALSVNDNPEKAAKTPPNENTSTTTQNDQSAKTTEQEDAAKKQDSNNTEKAEKENTKEENQEQKKEQAKESPEKEEGPKTYTLHIKEGMASSEISSLLEENKLIKDASEFSDYLEENDYSQRVQIGKYKLNTDMGPYQIAEAITK